MTMDRRTVLKTVGVLAFGLQVGAETSQPAEAESTGTNDIEARRKAMSNVNEIVVRYLSAWNERDAARRGDLVAKTWSEDGTYVDGARQGAGHVAADNPGLQASRWQALLQAQSFVKLVFSDDSVLHKELA